MRETDCPDTDAGEWANVVVRVCRYSLLNATFIPRRKKTKSSCTSEDGVVIVGLKGERRRFKIIIQAIKRVID